MGCSGSRSNKANEIAIKPKGETDTKSNCKEGEHKQSLNSAPVSENKHIDKSMTPGVEKSNSFKGPTTESHVINWLNSIYTSVKSHLTIKL